MLSFLLTVLFTVIMLTALFSATAGLAFIFRRSALKGKESGMYYIWLLVLILAFVPIKIGEPNLILFPQENPQAQINNNIDTGFNNSRTKFSDLMNNNFSRADMPDDILNFNTNANREIPISGHTDINTTDVKFKNDVNIFKIMNDSKDIILSGLLIIWLFGFLFVTVKTIYNYFKMKKLFYIESDICENERINNIFNECIDIVGLNKIKNRISLRVIKRSFSSPCVCGLLKPTVFIDESCVSLSDTKLKYIFIHELYHIKRYDMLYKVMSIIVAGVHWFNPLTYKVVKTIAEDCELSVDRHVMNVFGNEWSEYYMNIILDIAERKCAERNRPLVKIPSTSLFFGEKRNIDFLKRRYANMKNIANKKFLVIALSIFMAAIITINIVIMSSCGIIGTPAAAAAQLSETVYICPDVNIYEAALRLYFGLLPDEEITQQHFDEITEIKIIKGINTNGIMVNEINDISLGNLTPVSFVINGRELNMLPSIVHRKYFEDYIIRTISESDINKNGGTQRVIDKFNAYYSLKDPNESYLTPEAKEEMILTCPLSAEFPLYQFDPNASIREYMHMLGFLAETKLLDDKFAQNGTMDASYLLNFPNLQNATFSGLKMQNLELLPVTVSTHQEENPYIYIDDEWNVVIDENGYVTVNENFNAPMQSSTGQPLSGVFEPPNYGINMIENDFYGLPDGTQYLEFKNESLKCAIAEYFNVVNGEYMDFLPWNPITLDMLNKITSINVRRIPEYDFVFDHPEAQMPFKGMYLEYTINGKTLDILPETYRIEIEQFFGDNSLGIDISQYLDPVTYGFAENGDEVYRLIHYVPKSDISEEDKLCILSELSKIGLIRIAIYQDDDGSYFTVGRPDLWGFTPRYYDRPEYDATDIAYMPNLQEFTLDGISAK